MRDEKPEALAHYVGALRLADELVEAYPDDERFRSDRAYLLPFVAAAYRFNGELEQSPALAERGNTEIAALRGGRRPAASPSGGPVRK